MSSRSEWMRGMSAVVLVGGLMITGWGLGVASAAPPASNPGNPFQVILDKLDQALAAITAAGGQGNHTLQWDQALPAAQRFVILSAFNSDAVLDKNTGLVWEKSPQGDNTTWSTALGLCLIKDVGGQKGWRLPAIPELASLYDSSVAGPGPTLPLGHPFVNVQSGGYWSATTISYLSTHSWEVIFRPGNLGGVSLDDKGLGGYVWCVRGPMQESVY
jgi:hypothetical protein